MKGRKEGRKEKCCSVAENPQECGKNKKNYIEVKMGERGGGRVTTRLGRRKIYNILPTIMLLCERALIPPAWLYPRAIFVPNPTQSDCGAALRVLSRRITYIIDTLTLASNCREGGGG